MLTVSGKSQLNGDVAVGTTTVPRTLDVKGTLKQNNTTVCLSDGTSCPNPVGPVGDGYIPKATPQGFVNSAMYQDNTANIGVGTTTPTVKFDVNGGVRADTLRLNQTVSAGGNLTVGNNLQSVASCTSANQGEIILLDMYTTLTSTGGYHNNYLAVCALVGSGGTSPYPNTSQAYNWKILQFVP
jgi:hypothetical protein